MEFDRGDVLLSNEHSYFSALVEQTGAAEAEYLRRLANAKECNREEEVQEVSVGEEERAAETSETDPLMSSS